MWKNLKSNRKLKLTWTKNEGSQILHVISVTAISLNEKKNCSNFTPFWFYAYIILYVNVQYILDRSNGTIGQRGIFWEVKWKCTKWWSDTALRCEDNKITTVIVCADQTYQWHTHFLWCMYFYHSDSTSNLPDLCTKERIHKYPFINRSNLCHSVNLWHELPYIKYISYDRSKMKNEDIF